MKKSRKIKNVKIHARAKKVLWHGIDNIICAIDSGRKEVCGSREKFSGGEERAERQRRLLRNVAQRSFNSWPLALLRKAFAWDTEKWDIM